MTWIPLESAGASLLFDDPDFDLGMDVSVEPDRYPIDSQRTNGLMQLDLPPLDSKSLCFQLVRDVRGRDGTEELALVADAR